MLLLLVSAMSLTAGEAPPESERVGNLGGEACLAFEGNQTFSQGNILNVLGVTLEFHAQSYPSAPLSDYLAWIHQTMLRGYQQKGFAKAVVTVKADRAAQRVRVRITEGPRFLCGEVRVSGLEKTLADQLIGRLREAATMLEPMKRTGLPSFGWPWREGNHVPADPASLAAFERSVLEALTELNHHQAEVHIELAPDENRRQADLLIKVKKPGVVGTLDRIEVTGLRANTRDELLAFLELRPGMALAGNVTNDAVQRLWDSARFRAHEAKLLPLAESGRFKLDLAVVEYTNAPPLKQELTAEEQAFLKLREWVMEWKNRAEDWVLELEATRDGRRYSAEVILGQEGLAIVRREPHSTNQASLSYALVAAPGLVGLYSGPQQSKLVGKPRGGQLKVFLMLKGEPREDHGSLQVSAGAGWETASGGAPYALRLDLAPVAFVWFAHPREAACRVEQGVLSVRSKADAEEEMELTADAVTGRLIRFSMTSLSKSGRLALRCEERAFARVLREVGTGSATFTNGLDSQRPWTSSLAFLGREFQGMLKKEFPEILEQLGRQFVGGLTSEEALEALATLEELPWDELLAPFDLSTSATRQEDDAEEFPFVLDWPLPDEQASSDWVKLFGGGMLRVNDDFWPRGSWPWAVLRDATFLAAGKARWVTNDVAQLAQTGNIGPLGCLFAAHAFSRFDPRLAVPFAKREAARATASAFQEDLRVLLRGEKAGQQFLRGTLQRAPSLKDKDLRLLTKLLGTNNLPLILDCVSALTTSSSQLPDEALRPVVERHWEKSLRPRLLTALAKDCLTALQTSPSQLDPSLAAEAADWLREAAEQHHAPAQMLLAQLYRGGVGVARDPAAAVTLIRKAAEQGYPHADCDLARMYLYGKEVPQNPAEATRWFRRGAEGGCTAAMVGLAKVLLTRDGASREDRDEAIRWLHKAAELHCVEAQAVLGEIYQQQGDMAQALRYYREAARGGLVQAQMRLGNLLSDGISTKSDYVEAWVCFKLAAAQGDTKAKRNATMLELMMSPEQIAEGKRRAQDWLEQRKKASANNQ